MQVGYDVEFQRRPEELWGSRAVVEWSFAWPGFGISFCASRRVRSASGARDFAWSAPEEGLADLRLFFR